MPLKLTWTDYPELCDDNLFVNNLHFEPSLSLNEKTNSHLFIEGDNYPVLKKLAEMNSSLAKSI